MLFRLAAPLLKPLVYVAAIGAVLQFVGIDVAGMLLDLAGQLVPDPWSFLGL